MDNNSEVTQSSLASEHSSMAIRKRKTISIKTAVIIVSVVIIGALAFYYKGLFIAATVNGSPISRFAVIRELEKESGKKTLDALITETLINDEIRKKGVTVSNDEVDAEIKNIEDQIKAQGKTLDQALAAQGITREYFKKQIAIQKKLEKLLADKIQVTDTEVEQYIKDNKVTIPKGQETDYKNQIKNQLQQKKFSDAAGSLIDSLRSQAKINYFVNF